MKSPDPRCCHELLPHQSRTPSTTHHRRTPCSPTRPRNAEVRRRHRSRCLPVLSNPRRQQQRQQPDGEPGCRRRVPCARPAGTTSGWQRAGRPRERRSAGDSETWIWRWWTGRKSEQNRVDDGGFGDGCGRIRGQCQAGRVLSLSWHAWNGRGEIEHNHLVWTWANTGGKEFRRIDFMVALVACSRLYRLKATGCWQIPSISRDKIQITLYNIH